MPDTAFEVRYMRRAQIAQDEPHEAEIKAVFQDDTGDIATAENGLRQCREAVERVLGLKASTTKVENPERSTTVGMQHTPPGSAEENGDVGTTEPKDTPETPKRRGRPTNVEVAEKRALEAKARLAADAALKSVSADPMADVMEDTPNISTGEERTEAANPMADVMDDDIPEAKAEIVEEDRPITDQELQNEAGRAVQRVGDSNIIRTMVRTNYRLTRLDECPPNLRRALVNDLKNLQKDGSIKAPEKK